MRTSKGFIIILLMVITVLGFYWFSASLIQEMRPDAADLPVSGNDEADEMRVMLVRLSSGHDLKNSVDSLVNFHGINKGCILTCSGVLREAGIRFTRQSATSHFKEVFEIASLSGILSVHGSHLQIIISNNNGNTIGGLVDEGCVVHSATEIIIGILPES